MLRALQAENRGPLPDDAVAGVFRQIMSACLALEQKLRIAYLGPAGTFSHAAVAQAFRRVRRRRAVRVDRRGVSRRRSGQTDYAVVPVENSTEGAVGRTLDLMCQTPLTIVRRGQAAHQQNLLSKRAGIRSPTITRVYSHAQSLAQCVHWLARHLPVVPRALPVASNAEAARLAAAEPGAAAIAGENAAAIYGLDVLAPHIEDEPNNTTRFWVLGRADGRRRPAATRPRW